MKYEVSSAKAVRINLISFCYWFKNKKLKTYMAQGYILEL